MKSYQELEPMVPKKRLETMTVVELIEVIHKLQKENKKLKDQIRDYKLRDSGNEISFWRKITCYSGWKPKQSEPENEDVKISYPTQK